MANESHANDRLRGIWQSQSSEGIRMSMDEIHSRAGKFQKKIYWRNAREYLAGLVVVVFFACNCWRTPDALVRLAFGSIIAGTLYVIWHLHRRGSARSLPADMGLASGIEFYRRELERQRDLLQNVWSWYLGPLIPGLVVLTVARAHASTGHLRHIGLSLAGFILFIALVFVFIGRLNQRGARRLQHQIDELHALEGRR